MKANKTCGTCESYMPANKQMICANTYYGEPKKENDTCDGWDMDFTYFSEMLEMLPEDAKKDSRYITDPMKLLRKYFDNL